MKLRLAEERSPSTLSLHTHITPRSVSADSVCGRAESSAQVHVFGQPKGGGIRPAQLALKLRCEKASLLPPFLGKRAEKLEGLVVTDDFEVIGPFNVVSWCVVSVLGPRPLAGPDDAVSFRPRGPEPDFLPDQLVRSGNSFRTSWSGAAEKLK